MRFIHTHRTPIVVQTLAALLMLLVGPVCALALPIQCPMVEPQPVVESCHAPEVPESSLDIPCCCALDDASLPAGLPAEASKASEGHNSADALEREPAVDCIPSIRDPGTFRPPAPPPPDLLTLHRVLLI